MRRWLEGLETRQGLDSLTRRSRWLVMGSFTLLLLLMLYRGLVVQSDSGSLTPIIAFVLPLALFMPSIIAHRPRGHAWLAFVSLLYFTQGVMVATLPGSGLRGLLEVIASLALFVGCMGYARFRSRQLRATS